MKYQQDFFGSRNEFSDYLKKTLTEIFSGNLTVEGQTVVIPSDRDLDYTVKYGVTEDGGSLTIKATWDTTVETEEE